MDLKIIADYKEFKKEVLIAFWLSVQLGCDPARLSATETMAI